MSREKLIELQKKADEAKYLKGFEEQYDPSGDMIFCNWCKFQSRHCLCMLRYEERVDRMACGKAYAKYIANKK